MKKETNLKPDINEISKINNENNEISKINKMNEQFLKSLEKVSSSDLYPIVQLSEEIHDLLFHLKFKVEPNLSRLERVNSESPDLTFCELSDNEDHIKNLREPLEERRLRDSSNLFEIFDYKISSPHKHSDDMYLYDQREEMNITVREEFENKIRYFRNCTEQLDLMNKSLTYSISQLQKDIEEFYEKHINSTSINSTSIFNIR